MISGRPKRFSFRDWSFHQMIFPGILCLTYLASGCGASLSARFKMLRGQANNYTLEDIPREEDLEYPRHNKRILNVIQDMWEKYYMCLIGKEYQDSKPEIRRLLPGQYTELACDICPRPFQNYDDLEWKYKPLDPGTKGQELQYLDLTPEMTCTENKTIRIFNAVEALAGLYVCFHKRDAVSVYILEISKNDTTERVDTYTEPEELYVQSGDTEFQVSYRWTEWTECSACGRVGKKYKYGTCYVTPKQVIDDELLSSNRKRRRRSVSPDEQMDSDSFEQIETRWCVSNGSKEQLPQNKENNTEACENDDWDLEIVDRFSTGIPCASPYLPKSISESVQRLKSVKVLVKFCWEACQETEIFEVFDSNYNLIECANNTAGIYSVFQKIPRLPHDIERRTISADFGTDIIIQCPGTSFTNTPVIWKIDKQIIFPDVVEIESKGRFTVDLVNRIHLKKLRLRDSRIYSCWQKEKLVGTVNLNVEKKFKIVFDHHVTLIAVVAAAGILLFVGSKAVGRELKRRKK